MFGGFDCSINLTRRVFRVMYSNRFDRKETWL